MGLLKTFGHTDDYAGFLLYGSGTLHLLNNDTTLMGRPLNSLLNAVQYNISDQYWCLKIIRAMALIQLFWIISKTSDLIQKSSRQGATISTFIALLLYLNPSTSVFMTWTLTSVSFLASTIAFAAGCWHSEQPLKASSGRSFIYSSISVGFLLIVSMAIYQQGVFFYLIPFAIKGLLCADKDSTLKWGKSLATIMVSMVIYLLIYKGTIYFLGIETWSSSRGSIRFDFIRNLSRFYELPLKASFTSWAVFLSQQSITATIGLLNLGLVLLGMLRIQRHSGTINLLILFLFVCASYAIACSSMLLTTGNAPFRTFAFLYVLVHLGVINGLLLFHLWIPALTKLAVTLIAILSILLASLFTYRGIIKPHSLEFSKFRDHVFSLDAPIPKVSLFLMPQLDNIAAFPNPVAEFGTYSTWLDWVPNPLLLMLFRERDGLDPIPEGRRAWRNFHVIRIYPWQNHSREVPLLIIDGQEVLSGNPTPMPEDFKGKRKGPANRSQVDHEVLGLVSNFNNGWYYSEKLGYIRITELPDAYHWGLGDIKVHGGNDMTVHTENGEFHFSLDSFPTARDASGKLVQFKISGVEDFEILELDSPNSSGSP
jgi:hypothetical protein